MSDPLRMLEAWMNEFSTATRGEVYDRARRRCERCGGQVWLHLHHRRRRRVTDPHSACACNALLLCSRCHDWAHLNPRAARDAGLIVHSTVKEPWAIPVSLRHGTVTLSCSRSMDVTEPAY